MEEQILMTVLRFKGEGYGVNVFQFLERINEKQVTLGVVYDVLERLRKHGYVETCMGKPSPVRGGMRKKFYKITDKGIDQLVSARETYNRIMDGFDDLLQQHRLKIPD